MFYVLDENHNLIEAYDKEGVLAVLEKAIKDGSLSGITADSAFISKIRCCVSGQANRMAFVTQAQYNNLKASGTLESNCIYHITDDTTGEDISEALNLLNEALGEVDEKLNKVIDGSTSVPKAKTAEKATEAGRITPFVAFDETMTYDSSYKYRYLCPLQTNRLYKVAVINSEYPNHRIFEFLATGKYASATSVEITEGSANEGLVTTTLWEWAEIKLPDEASMDSEGWYAKLYVTEDGELYIRFDDIPKNSTCTVKVLSFDIGL